MTKVYPLTNKPQKVLNVFENLKFSGGHNNESNAVEGLASAYQVTKKHSFYSKSLVFKDIRWKENSEKYLILITSKLSEIESIQPGN